MSNTVSGLQIEGYAAQIQPILHKSLVAMDIASTEISNDLREGDTVNRPYISTASATDYTPGSTISVQDFTSTQESLTVDQKKVVPHYIDNVNQLQMNYGIQNELAEESAYTLRDNIDQKVLAEQSNAGQTLDDGDLGGTAGSAVTATTGNIIEIYSLARKLLRDKNVPEGGDWFSVISTSTAEIMERVATDKGFRTADTTLKNGFAGNFMGFKVYISNNLDSGAYGGVTSDFHVFGKQGAIDLALQKSPTVEMRKPANQLGANMFAWAVYGVKTFNKKADWFLRVPIAQ